MKTVADNEFLHTFDNLFDADNRDKFRTSHVTISTVAELAEAIENK